MAAIALLGCASALSGLAAPVPEASYAVGQFWEYVHEGPRPGAPEPRSIDGRRVLRVLESLGTNGEPHWVIEDRYTSDPQFVGRFHVRGDRTLAAIGMEDEKGQSQILTYSKPVPFQWVDLQVGESLQIATELLIQNGAFKMPFQIRIRRLPDESVETPAGRFADCRVYRSDADSIIDIKLTKVTFKDHIQWWYSDGARGTVKEVYSTDPVKFLTFSRESYACTNTLVAFAVQGASDAPRTAAARDVRPVAAPPTRSGTHPGWKWITVLAAGTLLAAIGWRGWRRRSAARH